MAATEEPDSVDVLIVGAGVSGIGAAYYLQRDHSGRSYAILEARGASGGTWDLFRYPGVRSDSDLHTFGYEFRPWRTDTAIADCGSILAYLRETAAEYGIDRQIRFHTKVVGAAWSSAEARWTVTTQNAETGERGTAQLRLAVLRGGLLPLRRGVHPANSRDASGSAGRSSTRSSGRRTSTTRASACWSSAAARPRSRCVPALAATPRTSPCCSAPPATCCRSRRGTRSRPASWLFGAQRALRDRPA